MLTTLTVTVPPIAEPVSLDLAKHHARIPHDSDDILIEGYLTSARVMAEAYTGRALLAQTLTWTLQTEDALRPADCHFLYRQPLFLPRSPVQSINSVTVLDLLGNSTLLPPATLPIVPPTLTAGYVVDLALMPASIRFGQASVLDDGRPLRIVNLQHVAIEFIAGYPDQASIPQPILNAILMGTSFLYEHRGDAQVEMPDAMRWLLNPYRLSWV